jgi:hypothetical protein
MLRLLSQKPLTKSYRDITTQHVKTARLGLIWLTVLALTLLVLLGYQIVHL